ncbi:MAG: aminopeptidase [Bdellovibrionales bacterium]
MTVSTLTNIWLLSLILLLSGCQLPYLVSGAFEQVRILNSRQKIEKTIENVAITPQTKAKLEFSIEAKEFAASNGLTCKKNFDTYVELGRPYVSYLVIASKKNEVKPKKWWFPIVGSFPYKGYFSKGKALAAAKTLDSKDYDTYTRGVTAYSSLGWFKEPILSSMLKGDKYSLAKTIFHECFHTTFFIKNNTEANERLAVFFAHHFMVEFLEHLNDFKQKEKELLSWKDSKEFTLFLEKTIKDSIKYYRNHTDREALFSNIQTNYVEELKPLLKVNNYDYIFLKGLNNAKLAAFKTYFHKFNFLEETLSSDFNGDIFAYLTKIKSLEGRKEKTDFFN